MDRWGIALNAEMAYETSLMLCWALDWVGAQ